MEVKDWEALKDERRTRMIAGFTLHGWRPMSAQLPRGKPTGLLHDIDGFCFWSPKHKCYKIVPNVLRENPRAERKWRYISTETLEEFYKCVFKELPWASSLTELAEEETSD